MDSKNTPAVNNHKEETIAGATILEETNIKLPEFGLANRYPKGFRFKPTDEELIVHYLEKRIKSTKTNPFDEIIYDADVYHDSPQALAEIFPSLGGNEWYFFTPRKRKYRNGTRPNRAADTGFWKATGADKNIVIDGKKIGFRKALVFFEGKPSKDLGNKKSNWIMHEYRVNQPHRSKTNPDDMRLDDWVLCRIYLKATKSSRKRPEVDLVDQSQPEVCPEENTIATDDNYAIIIPENNYVVEQSHDHGVINNFGDYVPQNYENALVQGIPHLLEGSSVAYNNPQINFDHSQNEFHNYGGPILMSQHYGSIPMQNSFDNDYYDQMFGSLGLDDNLGPCDLDALQYYDYSTLEDESIDDVKPNVLDDHNQFMSKRRRL
ncbi:hypothetical protein BUALT_Bualt19G0022500 [Buddleja alternifolia]|uniref:NAC domain-containing protein n=1 Tax=Buddleja alternifolia TaxID=168488 RepID=A0AAV6W860_9LAMI|nr:hypothetical protein BUALT_Bualt19G0022500 [Buddleja alternifolia]